MTELDELDVDENSKKSKAKQQNDPKQVDKAKVQSNSKKNKKKKNKAKDISEKQEQEKIQVVDDVVIIKQTSANAPSNAEVAEQTETAAPKTADGNADQPTANSKKNIRIRKNKKKKKTVVEEGLKQTTDTNLIEDIRSTSETKIPQSEEKKRPVYELAAVENLMTQSETSLEHNKHQLEQLIDQDSKIKQQETELQVYAKQVLID